MIGAACWRAKSTLATAIVVDAMATRPELARVRVRSRTRSEERRKADDDARSFSPGASC